MRRTITMLLLCITPLMAGNEVKINELPKGSSIGFLGDSITQGVTLCRQKEKDKMGAYLPEQDRPGLVLHQGGLYHQYLQLFLSTRFPGKDLWTVNFGQSGGKADGALDRIDWDLMPHKTDIVFVNFGMNDVGYLGLLNEKTDEKEKLEKRETYRKNLSDVVDKLIKKECEVVVMSATPFENRKGEAGELAVEAELLVYSQVAQQIAEERQLPFIDLHEALMRVRREQRKKNKSFKFTGDRIHPNGFLGGSEVMLHEILKTRLGQSRVYEMSFDVKGNVTDQKGAAVSNISHADGQLSFQLSETALPFPIDQKKDVGFKYVPFAQEFNRQSLKIDGLDDGEYTLKIDDQDVGTYTAKKLSEGIDLSDNINTPQYIKALELREKILGRKIILEQWMRIIRSNLKKSLSWQDKEGGKNIDWDDTKSILASVQRVIAAGQSKKGGFTGWRAYVMTSAEHALENYPALVEELAQMRMDLSKVNVAETRQYSLTKK